MDFDGDIIFSTNDKIISKGSYDYGVARPLYYELSASGLVGVINNDNLTQADIRGLNSKVGQISNRAATLYAMLKEHHPNSAEYKKIYDSIIALGEIVGMEIDRIKTGIKPTMPMEWKPYQVEWRKGNDIFSDDIMITPEEEAQGIYRHNSLVPDVKPYFLRYNYKYLDSDIRRLRKVVNQCSVINFGLKIDELEEECRTNTATEDMKKLYQTYINTYPVNDADCIVNHISHLFEGVHLDLQKQIANDGRNMLLDFVSNNILDADILKRVQDIYDGYRRFLRMETKNYNSNRQDGAKDNKSNTFVIIDCMRAHFRYELYKTCGSIQKSFDYLVTIAKGYEKVVWDILGDDILTVLEERKDDYI